MCKINTLYISVIILSIYSCASGKYIEKINSDENNILANEIFTNRIHQTSSYNKKKTTTYNYISTTNNNLNTDLTTINPFASTIVGKYSQTSPVESSHNTIYSFSEFPNKDETENATTEKIEITKERKCSISNEVIDEIRSYQNVTNLIIKTVLSGEYKSKTYNDLSYFVDKFGARASGTQNLEDSIDYMLQFLKDEKLENVHGEEVMVPHWVRGEESAEMISPRRKKLSILGLGFSVGTPENGVQAEILVVKNFDDLRSKANQAKGKIIVYNEEYVSYGKSVIYRELGASEAAKVGGVAALVRSVTPFSINSPHTGMQEYEKNVTKIPAASITVEDAQMFQRMQDRGWKIIVILKMSAKTLPLVKSRNVVAEINGTTLPNDIVVVSGHIDSWDVGDGAMDDGGGAFISVEALSVLKFLNLRPRRTLRAILWTAEEPGLWGVQDYVKKHESELSSFKTVFESDIGTFRPLGLDFSGSDEGGCIVEEILKLFESMNTTLFRQSPDVGSDITYFIEKGVPGLSLNTENSKYFYFHHSEGDRMTVEDRSELDLCTALWAAASYVVADLSVELPRK